MKIKWNKFSEVMPPEDNEYYVTLECENFPNERLVKRLWYDGSRHCFKQIKDRRILFTNENVIAWAYIEDIEPYYGD